VIKQIVARTIVGAVPALFAAGVSVGAYQDGGWSLVAATWIGVTLLVILARAFVWGIDNWKAKP
jgi:hypothetical protein